MEHVNDFREVIQPSKSRSLASNGRTVGRAGGFIGTTLSKFGLAGLYITFVLGVHRLVRLQSSDLRMRIPYENFLSCDRLVDLYRKLYLKYWLFTKVSKAQWASKQLGICTFRSCKRLCDALCCKSFLL